MALSRLPDEFLCRARGWGTGRVRDYAELGRAEEESGMADDRGVIGTGGCCADCGYYPHCTASSYFSRACFCWLTGY